MSNQLHDDVLNFLETYRTKHPDFLYWLRQRNTKNRLNEGYWFQGNLDYAFVGLYDRSGGSNMTRSMGIVFEKVEGNLICYFEVVFNEEADKKFLHFYKELMQEIGGFKRISDTKFRKILSEDKPYSAAEAFLDNTKTGIDSFIEKSGLSNLFIDKNKFYDKLKNILKMKAEINKGLFPENKIQELKARFNTFKTEDFYNYRIQQLQFIPFAKKVIEESLSTTQLSNETFSNLIQCLKNGALEKTVESCLNKNIENVSERASLIQQYKKLKLTGYTGAGRMAIYGLDASQLNDVRSFLLNCAQINNLEDAIREVESYENKKIPQVTKGVYSPWLYYLNSKIFPIHNNSHSDFIKWCEQPTDSYTLAIQLFHEVADILEEKELGVIDAFAHKFIPGKKPEPLKQETSTMSLNTILYGPPGTGKTYNTINKAVAIANPEFDQATCSRDELQKEYNRLYKDGQIEFITFHQGMSYEDFIEGIKPMEPREGDEFLKYEIKEGIFKRLCEKAAKIPEAKPEKFSISNDSFEKAGFYKISLGDTSNPDDDQIYEWCIANGYIALGWGDAIDFNGKTENDIQQMVPEQLERFAAQSVNYFIHYLKPGDYVVVTFGNLQFRAIGKVTGNYEFKNVDGLSVHQFRKVDWLVKNVELPYEEVYNKQFSQQSIYRLNKREIKRDFFVKTAGEKSDDTKIKNYVLIIDEINRGNVSQIFGELITLIEVNKRAGNEEALSVQLPYSKKQFSVPNNLYIIGTMNTADRSVEALDTALRRRFVFEEMMPKPELLEPKEMICRFWNQPEYSEMGWDEEPFLSKSELLYELLGIDVELLDEAEMEDEDAGWKASDLEINDTEYTGIRLNELLETINNRIERLLTRDNCIGHSYFLKVYSIKDLMNCVKDEIIPLLQEYFYGDYGKMALVLGKGFVDVDTSKSSDNQNYFAKADYDSVDSYLEKKVWKINQIESAEEFKEAIKLLLNK
jgi:5-methylcytosine-specific restriction endonuclease McrBC GTP-binding regulatory subunit McrB